jgi:hypothetical protein
MSEDWNNETRTRSNVRSTRAANHVRGDDGSPHVLSTQDSNLPGFPEIRHLKPETWISYGCPLPYSVSWLRIFCDSSWYWLWVMSPWFSIDLSSFSRATAEV